MKLDQHCEQVAAGMPRCGFEAPDSRTSEDVDQARNRGKRGHNEPRAQ